MRTERETVTGWALVRQEPPYPPRGPAAAQARLLVLGADALDVALDAVLEQAAREVGAQRCSVLLFDPAGGALMDRYWAEPGLDLLPRLQRPELPWIYPQLRAGRAVSFSRLSELPAQAREERRVLARAHVRSAILVPLLSAEHPALGWISFVTLDHEQAWTPAQLKSARSYGALIAPALLRLRAERERDEQLRTHAVLAAVSAAFLARPPQALGEVLREVLQILAQHLAAGRGTAWELDDDGGGMHLLAQWQDGVESVPALHQDVSHDGTEPVLRRHMQRNEPWCVGDVDELPADSEPTRVQLEIWGVGSFVAVPLRTGEREVGWLFFSRPGPSRWEQPQVQRLRLAADLVSAALVRARDEERAYAAEREAHRSRHLLQATLDALGSHVAITDARGRIFAVNEAWRRFAALAGGPGVGDSYLEAYRDAPELALLREAVPALLRGERSELRLTIPQTVRGEPRWFQVRVTFFELGGAQRLVFAHEDVTELKRAEEQLRELAGELVQVQDTERRRIANVLHDGAAQQVFAGVLGVRAAQRAGHPASRELGESREVLESALLQLRTLSHLLYPPLLEEAGLGPTLSAYVDSFSTRSGLTITLEGAEGLERLPPETEHALFRMVQEALLNVQRHSGSARARVRVEQRRSELRISVCDEGRGFPAATLAACPTVGLASMRQRLLQVGGLLELHSSPTGTEVRARVPRTPAS